MDGKAHGAPHGVGGEPAEHAATGRPEQDGPGLDVPAMDLETLRTVDHPVLSELVSDLRERLARPGAESLWGHDSSM